MIQVEHYSGDSIGGAARAAMRLNRSLQMQSSLISRLIVINKNSDDPTIFSINDQRLDKLAGGICELVDALPRRIANKPDSMPRSTGLGSRISAKKINDSSSDIINLHWINNGLLSIKQIGLINKPVIWTLHDMWPFCGAEHLADDSSSARWKTGYLPLHPKRGFDLDRWTWKRKNLHWKKSFQIVVPSSWLADCVTSSKLMSKFPVAIIPNALDTKVYKACNKLEARALLNLPADKKLILFGAIRGTQLNYKGWDLLLPALRKLGLERHDAEVVILGQSRPLPEPNLGMRSHWLGHLHDDVSLAVVYSACDVLVVPSRQESFGQTASEAHACKCPVVAFDATGIRDVVAHEKTGLLVKAYDYGLLADAVSTLLDDEPRRASYGSAARERAEALWSFSRVGGLYADLYHNVLIQAEQ